MPYEMVTLGPGQFGLKNKQTGKVVSRHDSKEKAMAAMRARMMAEGGKMMDEKK